MPFWRSDDIDYIFQSPSNFESLSLHPAESAQLELTVSLIPINFPLIGARHLAWKNRVSIIETPLLKVVLDTECNSVLFSLKPH